ncbi:MAG: PPC domain-containing protein [Archangiaceae bacterium]|nr:PPC domain-containing protein [Archangiaceae bacterium]
MMRFHVLLISSVVMLATACGSQLEPDALDTSDLELATPITASYTGNLAVGGYDWKSLPMSFEADGKLEATLTFPAGTNFNFYVYDASGELLGYANSATARPEQVTLQLPAGSYTIGVKCKEGAGAYTLTTKFTPAWSEVKFVGSFTATKRSAFHQVAATKGQTFEVSLDWTNASANMNVYLYNLDGSLAAYSNKAARPETFSYLAPATGTYRLYVNVNSLATDYTLRVRLRDTVAAPPTIPDPPEQPTDPTHAYPGKPAVGKALFGAAVGGNGDPVARHETPAKHVLALRRTFFAWDKRTTSMVTMAKNDLAAGRLPWVSTKTPSWADMGAGKYDADIDAMLKALEALGGPVWLTLHHEPEGGGGSVGPDDPGGPSAHVAMNRRVRARMTALGTKNISLAVILMSWTWDTRSGRDPEQWFAPGIYDLLGIDHYTETQNLVGPTFAKVRQFAANKGIDIAIGEYGLRGSDAAAGQGLQAWYDHVIGSGTDGKGGRVVGMCAFDSGLNSPNGSWELVGEQLTKFHALMNDPRSVTYREL